MVLTKAEEGQIQHGDYHSERWFEIVCEVLDREYPGYKDHVNTVIDLGAGVMGGSCRLAPLEYPGLEKIVTVDATYNTDLGNIPEGVEHVHELRLITDFLNDTIEQGYLVLLFGVNKSGIKTPEEYQQLYNVVIPGGFIVEAWEIALDGESMRTLGLEKVETGNEKINIWQKPNN